MITIGKSKYELVYNDKRYDLLESSLNGRSFISILHMNSGMLPTATLRTAIGIGMKKAGNDDYMDVAEAEDLAMKYIQKEGVPKATKELGGVLKRDLPFLFRLTSEA